MDLPFAIEEGYFYCVDYTPDVLEFLYQHHEQELVSFQVDRDQKTPFVNVTALPRDFRLNDDESSSESHKDVDSETERRLRELEESSYDDTNTPKIGVDYQCSIQAALEDPKFVDNDDEDGKAGELIWSPERLAPRAVDQYLALTQCEVEDDVDDFFAPSRNPDTSSIVDMANVNTDNGGRKKPTLITQEEAYHVLHQCNYDVEKARETLRQRNAVWSAKKREFDPWPEHEVQKFETGMRFHHKRFRKILKEDMIGINKTLGNVMQYYYTWKKLPRYAPWKKRRLNQRTFDDRPSAPVAPPPTIDPQTNAPMKFDEFFEFRQFMGLRSRPRIDYSSSSSGTHIWRTTTGGYKRKQRQEESSDTDDEGREFPPMEVFDVSIYADIDLDMVRHAKRARHEPVDFDDAKLLAELELQERADLNRLIGDVDDANAFSGLGGDPMVEQ